MATRAFCQGSAALHQRRVLTGDLPNQGSVPTYVQKAWRLEFASGHGKKLIAKSIS
jgi:hypothetical protein